jgi:hypothetical protein
MTSFNENIEVLAVAVILMTASSSGRVAGQSLNTTRPVYLHTHIDTMGNLTSWLNGPWVGDDT